MARLITNEKLIDLLAEGHKLPEISKEFNIKIPTLERRMGRLRAKHCCRTVTQLVIKLKYSGVSNTSA